MHAIYFGIHIIKYLPKKIAYFKMFRLQIHNFVDRNCNVSSCVNMGLNFITESKSQFLLMLSSGLRTTPWRRLGSRI